MKRTQLSDVLWQNVLGIKLVTGRKHQIRCHLSEFLINPILNDVLYHGKIDKTAEEGIYLHAAALKIQSPELLTDIIKLS